MNEVASLPAEALRVLVVDDEAPARTRLRDLLGDVADRQPNAIVGMAANGVEAVSGLPRPEVLGGPAAAFSADMIVGRE